MKKIILLTLIAISVLLTGCGNSSNKILDALNNASDEIIKEWNDNDSHSEFFISKIQDHLEDYTIIASGDREYTQATNDTKYTTQIIGSGNFSNQKIMDSDSEVKYILVYDNGNKRYYNLK